MQMLTILLLGTFLLVGCSFLEKRKQTPPPTVSTEQVIQSLNDTKSELVQAGESNTKVAKSIDKALTLAERLDALLEQIEKEQNSTNNKNVIKSIK